MDASLGYRCAYRLSRQFRLPGDANHQRFIIGMLLFLVAVGLTLIFGVLKVVNSATAPSTCSAPISR